MSSQTVVTAAAASVTPSSVNHPTQTQERAARGRDEQKNAPKNDAREPVADGKAAADIDLIIGTSHIARLERKRAKACEELRSAEGELAEVIRRQNCIVTGAPVVVGGDVQTSIQFLLDDLASSYNNSRRPSAAMSEAEKAVEEAKQRVGSLQKALQPLLGKVDAAAAAVDSAQTIVSELATASATQESIDRAKTGAKMELSDAEARLERAEARLDRAKTDLDRAKADLDRAKADLDRAKADVEARLERVKTDLDRAKADLDRNIAARKVGVEKIEKELSERFVIASRAFAKPTSSKSSKESYATDLTNAVCDVCGNAEHLSRAHVMRSELCDLRNMIVLCGTKGRTGTCHHKYDTDLMGILCVDPDEAAELSDEAEQSAASSGPQGLHPKNSSSDAADHDLDEAEESLDEADPAPRKWFSFDPLGNVTQLTNFRSSPSRQVVNMRARLLLQKLTPEARKKVAEGIFKVCRPQDKIGEIHLWLLSTSHAPLIIS